MKCTIASHAGFSGDTGGDQDDFSVLEAFGKAVGFGGIACDCAFGVDVADICCNAWFMPMSACSTVN